MIFASINSNQLSNSLFTVIYMILLLYQNISKVFHTVIYMAIALICSICIVHERVRVYSFDWICNNNLWMILRSIEIFYAPNNNSNNKRTKHFDWKSIKSKLYSLTMECCVILFRFAFVFVLLWIELIKIIDGERESEAWCVHPFVTHLQFKIIMRE